MKLKNRSNAQIKLKGHLNRKRALAPRGCKTKAINQHLGKRILTLSPISEIRNEVINTLQEQVNVLRSVGKNLDDLGKPSNKQQETKSLGNQTHLELLKVMGSHHQAMTTKSLRNQTSL